MVDVLLSGRFQRNDAETLLSIWMSASKVPEWNRDINLQYTRCERYIQ
jgi:hypothetical protein